MKMLTYTLWFIVDDGWVANSSRWEDGSLGIERQSVYELEQSELTPTEALASSTPCHWWCAV